MPATIRVFVAVPPADLRKGYDGLSQLARNGVKEDPLSGHLFAFANRRRDRIKILYWDRDGYAIWIKRLETGTYRWPSPTSDRVEWTTSELAAVLGGIDLDATRKRPRFALAASLNDQCLCLYDFTHNRNKGITPGDAAFPDDLDTAYRQIREQAETLRQQGHLIARLQHQLEQLLRQCYGRKGEAVDPDQLLLFKHGILAQTEPMALAPRPPAPSGSPPKSECHGRKPLPASLPRKRIVHDVAPESRACSDCGDERRPIGEKVREQLEYVPASLIVLKHVRPKHVCASCAAHVVIAARLPEPIEKGLPETGLLAHVITSKLADHLPLYRQEAIFRRHGSTWPS